jgi:hypothetical protein
MQAMGGLARRARNGAGGGFVAAVALVAAAGCTGILGVQDIEVDPTLGGGLVITDADGGAECEYARDCKELDTTPPRCATAECVAGKCVYRAEDLDQDGHRAARCSGPPGVSVAAGDDCDDADPQLYPGKEAECAATADGTPITFPGGAPTGACKLGKRTCNADGTVSACVGAVAPVPVTACTPDVDEACTGNPLEGCPCTAGQTTPCGSSAVGKCQKGSAACGADGKFGQCTNNVEPQARNCGSAEDYDCNGVGDNAEAACQCVGGAAPGATRACNTHAQDGTGQCKAGSQACTPSGSASAWSACAGDVGPQSELCDNLDRNCNGVAGVNEPAPAPPSGTTNCTKIYKCDAPGRGTLYYRTNIGFTNWSGSGTLWTAYAPQGDYSAGTYPPGTVRVARHSTTGKVLFPIGGGTCCQGCPQEILKHNDKEFFTAP